MRTLLAIVAAAVVLVPAADGAAWQTHRDAAGGYTIAVPAGWQVVPRSTAKVSALAAHLHALHQDALANQFAEIAAARRTQPAVYRFQAFQWPAPKGAVDPDVTVKVDGVSATARLPAIARQFERALGAPRGATIETPRRVQLPAGPAVRLAGTTRLGKSLHSAYVVYLLLRHTKLYSLAFRSASSQSSAATPLFEKIAARFRLA